VGEPEAQCEIPLRTHKERWNPFRRKKLPAIPCIALPKALPPVDPFIAHALQKYGIVPRSILANTSVHGQLARALRVNGGASGK
jgi:hypothetical protein